MDIYIEQDATSTSLKLRTARLTQTIMKQKSIPIPELIKPTDGCAPQYIFDKLFNMKIPERLDSGDRAGIYSANSPLQLTFSLGAYESVY